MKLRSVDEPLIKRLESEVRPEVTESVPVKLAADEMFWPLIVPEVMSPALIEVAKRLVEEAVVAKELVEVEFVVVEFLAVKFWRVVEPET